MGDLTLMEVIGQVLSKNPNGDIYAGEFLAHSYHGKGILEKVDGTLYVGDFEDGQYFGSGMLISSNGSIYTGQFAEGTQWVWGRRTGQWSSLFW